MDGNRQYPHEAAGANGEFRENEQASPITTTQLQRLVRLLDNSDVSEIEVKRAVSGMRLVLRKARASEGNGGEIYQVATLESGETAAPAVVDTRHTVTAPLVGIFHSWGKPKGPQLIHVDDRIKAGQLVGTIQSLNVINEVESSVAGRVVEILVQDGQPVEYGQPLVTVDSAEEA